MSLLVCLSGQIGAGKSSVRHALASELEWRHASFGDYLRSKIEQAGGDPTSREALQDLGKTEIESDSVGFCERVLASGGFRKGENFLIDGVRHIDVLRILRELSQPSATKLLFLGTTDDVRRSRVASRADHADFSRAEEHAVESEVRDGVRGIADVVIDANPAIEVVAAECLANIRAWSALGGHPSR